MLRFFGCFPDFGLLFCEKLLRTASDFGYKIALEIESVSSSYGAVERWIEGARNGSEESLGRIMEWCRAYLLALANDELATDLQGKLGASDLVQETFLEAHRDFGRFRGGSEDDLRAWLRAILHHNALNAGLRYRATGKRDVTREVPIRPDPDDGPWRALVDVQETPSAQVVQREQDEALKQALARLPEVYRQVVQWRNYEDCSYEEIGRRLDRSPEAARKLWTRAIDELTRLLEAADESSG